MHSPAENDLGLSSLIGFGQVEKIKLSQDNVSGDNNFIMTKQQTTKGYLVE